MSKMESRPPALKIRDAQVGDALAIAATYCLAKRHSLPDLITDRDCDLNFQADRWKDYLTHGSRAQFSKGDGYVHVAEVEGAVVGYLAWHSTSRHGTDAELQSLYILGEFQNQGIGGALLNHLEEKAMGHGVKSMCVGYDPANPYKRFYAKYGAKALNEHWSIWPDLSVISEKPN